MNEIREKMAVILDVIKELEVKNKRVNEDKLILHLIAGEWIKIIDILKKEGVIFEPSNGFIQRV